MVSLRFAHGEAKSEGVLMNSVAAGSTPDTLRRRAAAPHASERGLDQRALFRAWQGSGDQAAREELVQRYMPLARVLARRYRHTSEPFEDLVQVASLALLKAIDRYDPELGHSFKAFAVPTILGEMRRYFRDCAWALHVPRAAKEQARMVRDALEDLRRRHGRAPTVNQLAEFLELNAEQILDALAAIEAYETSPLDARRPGNEEDGMTYAEALGEEDERFDLVECDVAVRSALAEIAPRERRILRLRFVEDLTQSEIADRVGVSQMQVSRLLSRSLDRLRALTSSSAESSPAARRLLV